MPPPLLPHPTRPSKRPSSFHPQGKRKSIDARELRLRSDSTGSMKSAFYQGTIVTSNAEPVANKSTMKNSVAVTNNYNDYPNYNNTGIHRSTTRRSNKPVEVIVSPLKSGSYPVQSVNTNTTTTSGGRLQTIAHGNNDNLDEVSVQDAYFAADPVNNNNNNRLFSRGGIDSSLRYSESTAASSIMTPSFRQGLFGTNLFDSTRSDVDFSLRSNIAEASVKPTGLGSHDSLSKPSSSFHNYRKPNTGYGTTTDETLRSRANVRAKLERVSEDSIRDSQHSTAGAVPRVNKFTEYFMNWLSYDIDYDEQGVPFFNEKAGWSLAKLYRTFLFNPLYPEFTSLQQFNWAVLLGVAMGFYTAVWKTIIENCVDFMWKDVPETLLEWGVFTELDGNFPLYHYMWMCPALFGGVLSYIFAALPTPIPGQNEWIHNLHSRGVQESDTFGILFLLATAGMASGLSLGPELPLILTAGMIGSRLGIICKQSMLQARVLNLTAASAAIGGFFGFPMAGALFVLEVPHRMGLQYFEALSPATLASIVAVLTNRMVTGNDVTGYFQYPFMSDTLPSLIFTDAIIYGLFGAAIGLVYTRFVLKLKHGVHDWFHVHHDDDKKHHPPRHDGTSINTSETIPLVNATSTKHKTVSKPDKTHNHNSWCTISPEPYRAGVSGAIAGTLVGLTGMYFPHVMFWGEAQLQNLIDRGRTPLPVFGRGDDPSADLVAMSMCIIDPESSEQIKAGFGPGCAAAITVAKIFVTGLSLGTGIIGGHFWGPLLSGCAAAHFLMDVVKYFSSWTGFAGSLAAYPCVAVLCIMGSTHVVAFRAHTAIILILTLTIDAFDPEDALAFGSKVAGDYSAVFPLLTVAVFLALQLSRQTVFYEKQRSRGDIMALPEVLCEPGKEGKPLVMDYDGKLHELNESDYDYETDLESDRTSQDDDDNNNNIIITQHDIENAFEATNASSYFANGRPTTKELSDGTRTPSPLPPRPQEGNGRKNSMDRKLSPEEKKKSTRLDELLSTPLPTSEVTTDSNNRHRRTLSAPMADGRRPRSPEEQLAAAANANDNARRHRRVPSGGANLVRVNSFGELNNAQPSLLEQARGRAASYASTGQRRRDPTPPRMPRAGRKNSYDLSD